MILRSLILVFCLVPAAFSLEFTEVQIGGPEYAELFSNTSVNFSGARVYDESGSFNTVSLVRQTNSSFSIIGGSKFFDSINHSSLNCTLYTTDRSQLSNGGLKDSGENFTIVLANGTNLSFTYNTYTPQTTQTLCSHNFSIETNESLGTNQTEPLSCQEQFSIVGPSDVITNKLQFSFETTSENYIIEYWVETYGGVLANKKRTTSNTNTKSFTPLSKTEVYTIQAILTHDNCSYNDSHTVMFYSEQEEKEEREIEVLLNGKLVGEFFVEEGKKQSEDIKIELSPGKNTLSIEEEEFIVRIETESEQETLIVEKEVVKKDSPQLFPSLINSTLVFFIENQHNYTGDCIIYNNRTAVSSRVNTSNSLNVLSLNISKIKESAVQLKLSCRLKKPDKKTYDYYTTYFTYQKPSTPITIQSEHNTTVLATSEIIEPFVESPQRELAQSYTSSNLTFKQLAPYFIFGGVLLLGLLFLVRKLINAAQSTSHQQDKSQTHYKSPGSDQPL